MKLQTPWILQDSREQNLKIIDHVLTTREFKREEVHLGIKFGGPGDYIIVDKKNRLWGIERKSFNDMYNTIIQFDKDGSSRLHGQLSELVGEYGNKAVLMVHEYVPITRWVFHGKKKWKMSVYKNVRSAKRRVFSAMSTRSLIMPVWIVGDEEDAARFLVKMSQVLHMTTIRGRKIRLTREEDLHENGLDEKTSDGI